MDTDPVLVAIPSLAMDWVWVWVTDLVMAWDLVASATTGDTDWDITVVTDWAITVATVDMVATVDTGMA